MHSLWLRIIILSASSAHFPPPPLAYPLELKIESAADATADAKCHFGKCGHSAISLPRSASLFLFPSISLLALAMPQFKCRLTHCDAIASFLPFCFLSQIVCALELAKVEHVSALPLAACRFPLATCHLAHYFRPSTLPSDDILFNGTKSRAGPSPASLWLS